MTETKRMTMTLTSTMQCQRHENDDVNNRATKAMTDDKENNIDRDNSIVNDNEDKKIFFFRLVTSVGQRKNSESPLGI